MVDISVIMTCYNQSTLVRQSIKSIKDQTFQHWELIVVDDGSTDGSGEIISEEEALDERIHLLTVPHGGLSKARKAGIENAKGEWITFVDGDDLLLGYALEEMMKYAALSDVDVVQERLVSFSGDAPNIVCPSEYIHEIFTGQEVLLQYRRHVPDYGVEYGLVSKIIRRRLFDVHEIKDWLKAGGIRYPYNYINDFGIIPRLLYFAGKVVLLDIEGYLHRKHEGNISVSVHIYEHHYEKLKVADEAVTFFEQHGMQEAIRAHIADYFFIGLSYWYKGWLYEQESERFIEYQQEMTRFYEKYFHYVTGTGSGRWMSPREKVVIWLWRFSKSLWRMIVGGTYFERKYHYKKFLKEEER